MARRKNSASRNRAVAEVAARQYGVVSRRQLRDLGSSDAAIDRDLTSGRLFSVFHGVFAVGHPEVGGHGRLLAAVLACGDGTVVSHRSAASLLGLVSKAPVVIDVIASIEAGRKIDGIRRHHVRPPSRGEALVRKGIPCTSPARTLVDLAGVLGPRSLREAVERAAVLGGLDLAAIDAALTPRRRGAPMLKEILEPWRTVTDVDGQPALRSELEARLLALIGAAGLPVPLCNQTVPVDGSRLEVDFLWPRQRLVVEADGRAFHGNAAAFDRDRRRDRALQLSGYRVIRLTAGQIAAEPEAILAAIRDLVVR